MREIRVRRDIAPNDTLEVGLVDEGWTRVARTTAFNFQQGAMLNWVGASDELVFNDRAPGSDGLVARVVDAVTGAERRLSRPIYALDRAGRWATSLDFFRLHVLRVGYGSAGADKTLQGAR